jgi:thiol:disulfide interchange protein DsbC
VPRSERIVFAAPNPKHTITVFTDIECGYCRKLHQDLPELNRQGITVEYLAFPRMGPASQDFVDMISVWCAVDKRAALTAAKGGQAVKPKNCTSPVAMQYALGQQVGVSGTPAIFAADGSQLGGYLTPAQLAKALERQTK